MNLSVKNFVIFLSLYSLSLATTNFVANTLRYTARSTPYNDYWFCLLLPFPTITERDIKFPKEMSAELDPVCSHTGILLSILLFITFFYLIFIFNKKVDVAYWFVLFFILNLIIIVYFRFINVEWVPEVCC